MTKKIIPDSELIINPDGSVFHIHLRPDQLKDNIIVCGDPGRVNMIASYFDTIEYDVQSREFHTIAGTYNGKPVMALSHGIGSDNIDIVITELDALANIDFETRTVKDKHRALNIVRIGTSGGLQPYVVESDPGLVEKIGRDDMVRGYTISAVGFYGPQGREVRLPLAEPELNKRIEQFEYEGGHITNYEMESAALQGMAKMMGHHAITICSIIANRVATSANPNYKTAVNDLVQTVLERLLGD